MEKQSHLDRSITPTKETYDQLQYAYERLNAALFGGELPNCLMTLQRHRRTYGYFSGNRFAHQDGHSTDEIALNPAHFRDRPVHEVLATLAHEMVHLWQAHHGKPGRGRYHNKEWAAKMKAIGLQPTDTGEEGGKETGDAVHHLIVPGGRFERATSRMKTKGYDLKWTENPRISRAGKSAEAEEAGAENKSGKRARYDCPQPHHDDKGKEYVFRAWARHDAKLVCGEHMSAMEVADQTSKGASDEQ
jgi:predicted SprT family Zn-dependent metalloprotease